MPDVNLEVGKTYLCRNGHTTRIFCREGMRHVLFLSETRRLYDPDGNVTLKDEGIDHPFDIIGLCTKDPVSIDVSVESDVGYLNVFIKPRPEPLLLRIEDYTIEIISGEAPVVLKVR